MKRLHIGKSEKDLGRLVPVQVVGRKFRPAESIAYSEDVKNGLKQIKQDVADFSEFSPGKNINNPEIRSRFNGIVSRMENFVRENGCFYPDSLANDVISLGLENGGSVFGILFQANRIKDNIAGLSKNCRFLIH